MHGGESAETTPGKPFQSPGGCQGSVFGNLSGKPFLCQIKLLLQSDAIIIALIHSLTKERHLFQAVVLVALGGLSLGAALARLLAETFPARFAFLFNWPVAATLALVVAAFTLTHWRRVGHRFAQRAEKPLADILFQDALNHLALLLPLFYTFSPDIDLARGWALVGGGLTLLIALRIHHATELDLFYPSANRVLYLALFALPFALYLYTLTPSVGTKDGFELQVVSATLGIAHPTGYPLITLLGRLFIALLPVGSPAYRINVMCAFFAALSVPLIYAIGHRVLKRRVPAALAALTFAFTPTFWSQASIPEKYTLNVAFVATVIYLALRCAEDSAPKTGWFYGLAFVYGLSLTHHRTMLLLAPGLALYLLLTKPELLRQPKRLLIALGLFAAPLLLYLYIPWRAYAQGWQMTWTEFLSQITGSEYAPALRLDEWLVSPERRATYLRFLRNQFGYLGIGLGVIGWLSLLQRRRHFALFSFVAWATYVVFSIGYHAYYNDVNYFLPSHLIFAFWIGAGLDALAVGLAMMFQKLKRNARLLSLGTVGYWTLIALLPLHLISTVLPQVDMSQARNDLPWGQYVLNLDIPPGATILADSVKVAPLHYLTTVENVRPDISVLVLPDEFAYVKSLEAHLAQGLPVYLARYLPNLGGAYHLRSLGPLVKVSLSPLTDPTLPTHPLNTTFGDSIRLLGYDAPSLIAPRQGTLHLTLYWQPIESVQESYHVQLRLVGPSGHVWWEKEERLPVSDHYPTNAWRPGEVIPDYYEVPIEATLQPGDYCLEVGLFRPFAKTGLPVDGGPTDRIGLGTVTVTPGWESKPPQPVEIRRERLATNLTLIGVDAPERIRPGDQARLRLYWQTLGPLPDYQPDLLLWGDGSSSPSTTISWPNQYATSTWPSGEIMVTQHLLHTPAELNGYESNVALETITQPPGLLRVAHFRVEGVPITGPQATVNFGDQMLLLDYDIPHNELRPGETLEMTLNWQGLADMEEDYTIFIHLLGPDGQSHGQQDVWPHDGTYPTSTWPVGEVIADTYRVPLDATAPPGAYHVEVGVYLLRTMGRLPVLNADGHPVDDKRLIEGLIVRE